MSSIAHMLYKANKALWKLTKPVTVGVRVILIKDNKVLLVKHTYQDSWYLPGGKMKNGETYEHKNDNIIIFVCNDFTFSGKTDREIEKYDFFDLDRLPEGVSPGTQKRLMEYANGKTANYGLW